MAHGSVIYELAEKLGEILTARKIHCAVAESCTGGTLSGTLTAIPGSSGWFDRGFITYSNGAKEQMLGVPHRILRSYGAVSEQTARAMAEGVIANSHVDVSVAITGIAGPGGGSKKKPIGTVWVAWAGDLRPTFSHCYHFEGNRPAIRYQAVEVALEGLINRCDPASHPVLKKKTNERYFFAILPDEQLANELFKKAHDLIGDEACAKTPASKLHLTLSYLGSVPPDFLQEAMRIASSIKTKAFELTVDHADAWKKPSVYWLGSDCPPKGIMDLVNKLNFSLISAGFKPERKPFKPHITVARKWVKHDKPQHFSPIKWPIKEFCLVKSFKKQGIMHYEKIASWKLK